jgi:hypothetical protein
MRVRAPQTGKVSRMIDLSAVFRENGDAESPALRRLQSAAHATCLTGDHCACGVAIEPCPNQLLIGSK